MLWNLIWTRIDIRSKVYKLTSCSSISHALIGTIDQVKTELLILQKIHVWVEQDWNWLTNVEIWLVWLFALSTYSSYSQLLKSTILFQLWIMKCTQSVGKGKRRKPQLREKLMLFSSSFRQLARPPSGKVPR